MNHKDYNDVHRTVHSKYWGILITMGRLDLVEGVSMLEYGIWDCLLKYELRNFKTDLKHSCEIEMSLR